MRIIIDYCMWFKITMESMHLLYDTIRLIIICRKKQHIYTNNGIQYFTLTSIQYYQ